MHIQKNAPQFIGIGGKGCGLAVISELLDVHPEVHSPIPSLRFFSTDAFNEKSLSEYVDALCLAPQPAVCGESCPEYLSTRGVAERIAKTYPDTKLFVVVRNPIDRAIVEYQHAKASRTIPRGMTCAQYMTNFPESQTDGFFGRHLCRYAALYSSLQLYVIVYEDFVKDPLGVIQKFYGFLEIDTQFVPKRLSAFAPPPEEPKNPGKIKRLFRFIKKQIKKIHPPKEYGPITPPTPNQADYFLPQELSVFKNTFAADAAQLSRLLHRDMVVEWNLE